MKNCVNVNLNQDKIILKIEENSNQEEIIEALKKKLPDLKKLYKDEKTPIMVVGKVLKNKEIDEIQDIIKEEIDVTITFDSPRILGLHGIKKTYNKKIKESETKFHRGSLRSGQKIEYEGSIVILGDVNDGAEVIAGENIVVLGILRGLAHAGAKGNKEAIICAASIEATQLRISNIVKEVERGELSIQDIRTLAYINEDDNIILE